MSYLPNGNWKPTKHERRFQPQHLETSPCEQLVPALVGLLLALVTPAIHFDNEPNRRGVHVNDETPEEQDFPAEVHPKLSGRDGAPKHSLRLIECTAKLPGARRE